MEPMPQNDVAEVARLLDGLARQRFYGALELKFEAGRITTVRKTETLKPGHMAWDSHRDSRGQRDDRQR